MKKNTKIKAVTFNNRKKQMDISYTSGHKVRIHYRSLGIRKNLNNTWVDKESRGRSIGLELSDGHIDYMPYDQPLDIIKDPEYMLQNHIEHIIAQPLNTNILSQVVWNCLRDITPKKQK